MAEIKTKHADVIANVIKQTQFNQYPWPTEVVLDRGTEFMAKFTEIIQRDYRVTKCPITAQNPQANGICSVPFVHILPNWTKMTPGWES
eukprot:5177252-Ditylum_brightwellii.AAC.1